MFATLRHLAFRFALALLGMTVLCPAQAHVMDQSYVFLTIDEQSVSGRVEITIKDLNQVLGLQISEEGGVSMQEILTHVDKIDDYVLQQIEVGGNGNVGELEIVEHGYLNTSFAQYVRIYFRLPPDRKAIEYLDVRNNLIFHADEKHRSLLVVENNWKSGLLENELVIALTFSPDNERQRLDLSGGSVFTGFWAFIKLGMHHIWIGADHILFLIALLLPGVMLYSEGRWKGVPSFKPALITTIKIVTVFTVAHSVTLSLAALNLLTLPSRLVESIIAISIGIAALYILMPRVRLHAFWVVLVFGLFHGFGFANVLSEMQIPDKYMLWSLFGFNLGVEIGQVAIVLVLVPILYQIRNTTLYARMVLPIGALCLMLISVYWFIERAFDVDFQVGNTVRSLIGV